MRTLCVEQLAALVLTFLAIVAPLSAQTPEEAPVTVTVSLQHVQELQQWTGDFLKWQEEVDEWLGLRTQGSWSRFLEQHRKPDPPAWLQEACVLLADDKQFAQACELLGRWAEDPFTVRSRKAGATAVAQKEAPRNTVWWRHVHLDGLWSTMQSDLTTFGLLGMHLTVAMKGRAQVFIAPGILLVSVPSMYGSREVKAATDWGFTYQLFDAGRSIVHFNLVQAWILGGSPTLTDSKMTLAGFSISFKPRP